MTRRAGGTELDGSGGRSSGERDADAGNHVGCVLLAAGESTRFGGENKLLAAVDGTPMVRRSARTLLDANAAEVVVVVGHQRGAVREALAGLDVEFRRVESYAAGQSESVRAGVDAARRAGWDAAVFALGDMPFLDPSTVDELLRAYARTGGSIVAPTYRGRRGNPVLFDAIHFDALARVSGDRGGRRIVDEHPDAVLVDTDDLGVVRDVDYEAELERDPE